MKVLLSIKPQFAEKIFEGSKKFEFRRSIFKNPNVESIVVYATAPVSKVIGEFDIENILLKDLETLWSETEQYSGIERSFYDKYFVGKKNGYAIQVKEVRKYNKPLCIKKDYGLYPPQSFVYLA